MQHRKEMDGKTFYWYGWTDVESSAEESKEHLRVKGYITRIIKGSSSEPMQGFGNKIGYNVWYRPSKYGDNG